MLTGESIPVLRQAGDTVAAGTLNAGCNALRISVDRIGSDTVLAQIGRLVMQASNDRPELLQLTDRVASVFVSAVLLIAVVTAIVWWQIDPSQTFPIILSVLVVTCPCALALATPAALTVATTVLARRGFLIRRGQALHALAAVNHMVFDKTGTLTENALQIERTVAGKDIGKEAALNIAAALEASSAHPIARAFRNQTNITPANELLHIPGGGLEGRVDGQIFRIGTAEFAGALNAAHGNELRISNPNTRTIYLGSQSGLLARFEISEKLRVGTPALLRDLQALGIRSTIASGDHPAVVRALANRIGASDCHGGLLPEQKLALVKELQSRGAIVAAVGDGINDSPVLAGANVSIAMGNGTSIAQHSADCIWLGNQLTGMESAFVMARRTMGVVRQNIAWALVYNLTAIPLAVAGLLDPWMAALGMSLSSLLVMLNALRLGIPAANEGHENSAAHARNRELPVEIAT
jgi:Cu2+-exporting ATPase